MVCVFWTRYAKEVRSGAAMWPPILCFAPILQRRRIRLSKSEQRDVTMAWHVHRQQQHMRISCGSSYGYATLCSSSDAPASHHSNCPPASTTSSTSPAGDDREQHSHRSRIETSLSKALLRCLQLLSEDICLLCDRYHRIQDK